MMTPIWFVMDSFLTELLSHGTGGALCVNSQLFMASGYMYDAVPHQR